jgi:hypothetical protein
MPLLLTSDVNHQQEVTEEQVDSVAFLETLAGIGIMY